MSTCVPYGSCSRVGDAGLYYLIGGLQVNCRVMTSVLDAVFLSSGVSLTQTSCVLDTLMKRLEHRIRHPGAALLQLH
ncbi:hypothetical protein E2C01_066278 [Portunus trituberculatus]|uniref:Uncharacterized protein n=1 Tax=Portunus trituberculatus TaxID=210409 RepID=A0A5B7HPU9_PORTR|nr:hypothetical protein [Portunus trituberculatus]